MTDISMVKNPIKNPVVAFQGELGAYSEEAVHQHFGHKVTPLPCRAFEHIFAAVESGEADYGAVPVENSTAGSINKAYDLLRDYDLRVSGEILLRVHHCLMTLPENVGAIKEVRSHHQALAQCENYLNRQDYVAVPWYDTAGSAKDLAAEPAEGVAVIASKLAGQYHNLTILDEGIEDQPNNYTRFFVIGKEYAPCVPNCMTSLVFTVPNTPGVLYEILGEFARREINLSKLESRPRRNRPWQYVLYIDFEGHFQDENIGAALLGMLSRAASVKLLGSYPKSDQRENRSVQGQETLLQI